MNSKDFFGAFFLGTGIGLAVGILLAPAKGSDTVNKLSSNFKDKFDKFKDDAEDVVDNVESEGKNLINKGSNLAKDYLRDGQEKLDGLKPEFNKANL